MLTCSLRDVTRIGSVEGIPIDLQGVSAADGILTVAIGADGPLVAERAAVWHATVETSIARAKALGTGESPRFPDHPGDRVLFPVGPTVTLSDDPLPRPEHNLAEISGIDPPWKAWWRFVLPDHPPTGARVIVCIPALERGADDPVYAGSLRDILIPR